MLTSPATPKRLVNTGQTRGAAKAQHAPRSQDSSLLGEVGAQALQPHDPSPEARTGSREPGAGSQEPRPERNRKRLCCPAPPAAAGARVGGCTGKGGVPREGGRRTGGQAGRDGSAAPFELVPFPS